jgi:hypothetical protein
MELLRYHLGKLIVLSRMLEVIREVGKSMALITAQADLGLFE